jgi:hypothetical protein
MATRSTIAIQNADGTVTSIYCHNGGYLSHNGAILENYYNDENIARQLIGLGDLSSLGETIGNKVDFGDYDAHEGQCVAYARDRGETGVEAQTDRHWGALLESYGQEFNYLFVPGTGWLVDYGERSGWLAELLEKESAEA